LKTRPYGFIVLLSVFLGLNLLAPCFAATVQEIAKKLSTLPPDQRKKAIEDGARQEGQFVFYTSMSVQDNPKVMAAFEKAYPFVKTDVYRGTPRQGPDVMRSTS
jgi:hypothetical protein